MHLKNYMEEVVYGMMDTVLKEVKHCPCEKCLRDIAALALNDLPPRYIVTAAGQMYQKTQLLRQQYEVDAMAAIIKAAVIVNRSPRH